MKNIILILSSVFIASQLPAQDNNVWYSFWDKDSSLIGFKDKNGVIKIEPKFAAFTNRYRFENILVLWDENGDRYYLTKSGKMVGRDSLYIYDNAPDCEEEGFIRFRDNKTDKVGLFNRNGEIAVPAVYNFTTPVTNGLIEALVGATKKQMGEHYSWEGGKKLLIDTNNNILVENFEHEINLSFYTLLITPQPHTDTLRVNFKGVNGQYYSFIDNDKAFRSWLKLSLLNQFTKTGLLKNSYKEIFCWFEPSGWKAIPQTRFAEKNFETIKKILLALNSTKCDYYIVDESLNPYIYETAEYKKYFGNCGQPKNDRYPVKRFVISYNNKKRLTQDHFEFLRTDNGYKLIGVQLNSAKLQ